MTMITMIIIDIDASTTPPFGRACPDPKTHVDNRTVIAPDPHRR
jgi:hypothetical protein